MFLSVLRRVLPFTQYPTRYSNNHHYLYKNTIAMKEENQEKKTNDVDRGEKIITWIGIIAAIGLVALFVFYHLLTKGIIKLG
jgi:hypothetical protein